MCHAEDAQRAEFFLKESRLCGKGTGMRGLQGRTVCAPAKEGKGWLKGKPTLFLREKYCCFHRTQRTTWTLNSRNV